MEQSSPHVTEVKDEANTATENALIEKWERTLAEGGLGADLDPIIPEEVQELFPMDSENVADDFEAVASFESETETDIPASEKITLTQIERRIVERIKDLGWAATLDEANATTEQIARLADSGTAFLRATSYGETILAMANATNGDAERAAARIEKPHVEKFVPRMNRPATSAVMFLDHHPSEVAAEERTSRHCKFVSEEFRQTRRAAVAREILEAHGGRLTKEAKARMFERIFGKSIERAQYSGAELSEGFRREGFRREVKRSLARAASEALEQINDTQSARLTTWNDDPRSKGRFAERLEALSSRRGWMSEAALRHSIEQQIVSGKARQNTARAIYTASLGHATHRILHVLRRDGRMTLAELRRRFSTDPQEVNDALAKLAEAEKVRKLRSRRTGEVFIETKGHINEARYKQALRRIMASSKCGLRRSGGNGTQKPDRRNVA